MIKMVWNWIFKRLFTAKRVAYLIKNNQGEITELMKDSIQDVLEDEEIAGMVIQYTDGIYNRYLGKSGKLWSTIGGAQKGINYAIDGEMDKLNPFKGFLDEDGELSLSGIAKGILAQALRGTPGRQGSPQGHPTGTTGNRTPNMQRI